MEIFQINYQPKKIRKLTPKIWTAYREVLRVINHMSLYPSAFLLGRIGHRGGLKGKVEGGGGGPPYSTLQ